MRRSERVRPGYHLALVRVMLAGMRARRGSGAFLLVALSAGLGGCRGEELARVKLAKGGDSGEATWTTNGTKSAKVWAEYNGKWTGGKTPVVVYEVELLDGDKSVRKTECSTTTCSSRVCSHEVNVNGNGSGDCECQTGCTLEAPKDGTFTVKAQVKDAASMTESTDLSIIIRK
jgi:hypothetical protein